MPKPQVCGRCGEEIRWGWRNGSEGWLHRGDVDHFPAIGTPMADGAYEKILADLKASKVEEKTKDPIPPPEVTSTPIVIGDERLPTGAKSVLVLAEKQGWRGWATYSRGARVHASLGTFLSMSDYVVVRLDGGPVVAVGSWCDGKFGFAYLGRRRDDGRLRLESVNNRQLRDYLKEHPRGPE